MYNKRQSKAKSYEKASVVGTERHSRSVTEAKDDRTE
jgi:hypothetical protein